MSLLILLGAIFASLALGVLLAYGLCNAMFRIFWMHSGVESSRRQAPTMHLRS